MQEEPIHKEIECKEFFETDRVIQNTIAKYWKANSKERHYYIQDILLEIKVLLTCSKHNPSNSNCLECHYILRRYLQEYKPASSLVLSTHSYGKKEEQVR